MSTAAPQHPPTHGEHSGAHPAHLAHHFDTIGQQFDAGKLGMWVFLATEILMFGGLFCAYAVYRANNPDVFAFAHKELDTTLGAVNTVILIASSLTMAWGVRCAQLGKGRALVVCLALTLLGGFGFLAIKTVEYHKKWDHHLWVGRANEYHPGYTGPKQAHGPQKEKDGHDEKAKAPAPGDTTAAGVPGVDGPPLERSVVAPPALGPAGVTDSVLRSREKADAREAGHAGLHYDDMAPFDKGRTHIFFQIYFLMTGLHGLHVLIGMGLIFWVLVRALRPAARPHALALAPAGIGLFLAYVGVVVDGTILLYVGAGLAAVSIVGAILLYRRSRHRVKEGAGEFGPHYFIPVDLVGLYWHLVDLIWIFLFPLLYLIH